MLDSIILAAHSALMLLKQDWLPLVAVVIFLTIKLSRTGHFQSIRAQLEHQGMEVVRISPVTLGERQLILDHARTRGGGRFYHVVLNIGSIATRQIWTVENGTARKIN